MSAHGDGGLEVPVVFKTTGTLKEATFGAVSVSFGGA